MSGEHTAGGAWLTGKQVQPGVKKIKPQTYIAVRVKIIFQAHSSEHEENLHEKYAQHPQALETLILRSFWRLDVWVL